METNHASSNGVSRWLIGLALLLVVLGALFYGTLDSEIANLPGEERRALYLRTRETLRASCAHAQWSTLTEYCRDQASFIRRFPDCDRECRKLADRFAPSPSR